MKVKNVFMKHATVTSAYLLLCNADRHLREVLHVTFPTKTWANDEYMKT